ATIPSSRSSWWPRASTASRSILTRCSRRWRRWRRCERRGRRMSLLRQARNARGLLTSPARPSARSPRDRGACVTLSLHTPDRGPRPVQGQTMNRVRAGRQRRSVEPGLGLRSAGPGAGVSRPDATPMTTAHQPLARRYRPKRFEDVIGQRGVVDTLRNALASGRIAQSFIFAGPRGVGKTTTARLLAKALNCVNGPTPTPCSTRDICVEIAEGRDFDVLEIDAATHTGVDDVRQVIVEPLALAPMRGRYKIFIIDEVHRLSKQAFDALLKSIEEPPPYVKFMMATTDPQHVPETIKSRSQVFELKALPFASIRDQLRTVMAEEG